MPCNSVNRINHLARPRPLARPPVATIWEDPGRSSSMAGPMRTHYCGELRSIQGHQEVTLCGWVDRCRDHGGVIFIDLQDRAGTVLCRPPRFGGSNCP